MAATVYRFKWNSLSSAKLGQNVPGAIVLGASAPDRYVDVTVDDTALADLTDYMTSLGWVYDSTSPVSTPAQQSTQTNAHAAAHASAGVDPVTLAQSQVTGLTTDLSGKESTANKNAASGYAGLDASSKLTGSQQVYGTAANTAAQGNDSRLSDDRTASGLRTASTVVATAAAAAPSIGQVLTATGASAASWQTPSSGGTPGGTDGQVQYNNGGAFGGATGVSWDDTVGEVVQTAPTRLSPSSPPAHPSGTDIRVYSRLWANNPLLNVRGSHDDYPLQPHLSDVGLVLVLPGSGSSPSVSGASLSTSGTISHPSLSSTSWLSSLRRIRMATSATAGTEAGLRGSATQCYRGNVAERGGWFMGFHFAFPTAVSVSGSRFFVGLVADTGAPGNIDYSQFGDHLVGVGLDGGDSNFQIMHDANTGTATKVDLGANFARSNTDLYEFYLHAHPNNSVIYWMIENRVSDITASGTISTNLPGATNFLNFYAYCNNNTTAASAYLEVSNLYLETEI